MELQAQLKWRLATVEARASSSYFSSGHLAGPGEDELRSREEQRTGWSFAGAVLGAPELARGLGRTLGTPVGISDTADTSWHNIVCLNMKILLILSITNESMLFGFHWNCIS